MRRSYDANNVAKVLFPPPSRRLGWLIPSQGLGRVAGVGLLAGVSIFAAGCGVEPGSLAGQQAAEAAVTQPTPQSSIGQRSGDLKIDEESAKALKRLKTSKKDPFALSRSMRGIRARERVAAERSAAKEAVAAKEAANKARSEAKAAQRAKLKADKAESERSRGGLVIGDSVALGAEACLTRMDYQVNAVKSRSFSAGWAALKKIPRSSLPETVVVHLGTNGPFRAEEFRAVMEHLGDKHHVVWVTIALPNRDLYSFESSLNFMIKDLVDEYQNASLADWNAASAGKNWWFYGDQIHINGSGCQGFAEVVGAAARD